VTRIRTLAYSGISMVVSSMFLTSGAGETMPGGASGPVWVRPRKSDVQVHMSSGNKLENIGTLTQDAIVQVLREDRGWYQIRFTRDAAEFVGWVLKDDVVVEGTPANPPARHPKPEAAPNGTGQQKELPAEKKLSLQETHDKLLELTQIPIGESPVWKKQYNLSRLKSQRNESGSTTMQLFGAQRAKIDVLYLFDPDEVIEVFVEDKIRELKKFQKESHPDFGWIIDCYIRALEAYIEGKLPDLRRLVQQAERSWRTIPGLVVGF